ncbi:hypothetical protein CPB84DRAFT_1957423 [Gymnopilus junonius]|uniref:Lipid droplet-associated hydrolase n=1 Tax=Gymnopilus junonius TaxID=109634 RepID=A0A9P5TTS0_GYMJU|nr:hypothetical protein CPB84DRAFT_1957423 [Gymnopilus junonius]
MSMGRLPSFLHPISHANAVDSSFISAQFVHSSDLGSCHALWWPPHNDDKHPDILVLFIPGNPGVVDFYIPFLSLLHQNHGTSNLAIVARGHLDHYFGIKNVGKTRYQDDHSLQVQVQSSMEVLESIVKSYTKKTKIIVIGHSVGAWITMQMLQARSDAITAAFLLFPAISNIADTPNGRLFSANEPIFSPTVRRILSSVTFLTVYLPEYAFTTLYSAWPKEQLRVLRDFLSSPTSVLAALSMAYQEMKYIRDLDLDLLEQHKPKLYFYYAQKDDWIGEERQRVFHAMNAEEQSLNMLLAPKGIPHAFCISHGELVAQQCQEWLQQLLKSVK